MTRSASRSLQKTQSFTETAACGRREHPDIQKNSDAMGEKAAVENAVFQETELYAPGFVAGDGVGEHARRDAVGVGFRIEEIPDRLQSSVEAAPLRFLADAEGVGKSFGVEERQHFGHHMECGF